ncbi:MAG: sn-glycerol-1-phosphate dehydrogenase [Desulfobacterales bacterium]|nr:MAG: sn-glycerol-1-phosphate dehydrogenase [Desulfobacterales bacterium]
MISIDNKARFRYRMIVDMNKAKIKNAIKSAADTAECLIGPDCIYQLPDIFKKYFPGAKAVVVADDNTFKAAGRRVNDKLKSIGFEVINPFVFPAKPMLHADYRHVEALRDFLITYDTIAIAVGSGTINDIVKLASHESSRKYMVVPTAASVDGYSAYGASISINGLKQTLECAAPLVIVADTQVLQKAPTEMTAAGYADLLGKITAGADWIIADSINVEAIGPASWNMVQTDLRQWTSQPKNLSEGDLRAIEHLFEGLIMTGLAMQTQKSSRPASGTEHLFSHTWEMQNLEKDGVPVSHGFKVGIGTLAACAMMETIFAKDINQLNIDTACDKYPSPTEREKQVRNALGATPAGIGPGGRWAKRRSAKENLLGSQSIGRRIVEQAGEGIVSGIVTASRSKHLSKNDLRDRLGLIKSRWNDMRSKVSTHLLPYSELLARLAAAGCPTAPDQINLSREQVKETFLLAQMIRERYTVLDLAYEMSWLEDGVQEIYLSDTYL